MRRVAWFVLAGALWCATPASAREAPPHDDDQRICYSSDTPRKCAERNYYQLTEFTGTVLKRWRTMFERATWKTDSDCQKVKAAVLKAFRMTESAVDGETMGIFFGLPSVDDPLWYGSYMPGLSDSTAHLIMINDTMGIVQKFTTIMHEAAHFAGYAANHSESWNANDAEHCAERQRVDNGGGSNENDPDDDDENCSTKTVWIPVWTPCVSEPTGPVPCNPSCGEVVACWIQVLIPKEVKTCY